MIYRISDIYGQMSEDDVNEDVARFFAQYIRTHDIEDIEPDDVGDVFLLYMCRYLEYRDKKFDISQN